MGCRLDYSRDWAVRAVHEAAEPANGCAKESCFVTLTYDPANLPEDRSVDPSELQLFMKRLRKLLEPKRIRFLACGEYGERSFRPHYHLLVFGHDFSDDSVPISTPKGKHPLWRSRTLEKAWPYGFASIGALTWESAAYTARYIMKKINGADQEEHYRFPDENGEMYEVSPEFLRVSNRPGLGSAWIERFFSDVYPRDFVVVNGRKYLPPRAYDKYAAERDPEMFEEVQVMRQRRAALPANRDESQPDRLRVRQEVKEAQITYLSREVE